MKLFFTALIISVLAVPSFADSPEATVRQIYKYAASGNVKEVQTRLTSQALKQFGNEKGLQTLNNEKNGLTKLRFETKATSARTSASNESFIVDVYGKSGSEQSRIRSFDVACKVATFSTGCGLGSHEICSDTKRYSCLVTGSSR